MDPGDEAPPGRPAADVTQLLGELRAGVPDAFERLLPHVYDDLSRIAHRQLRLEPAGHTLSTTAVVHEAWLRLAGQTTADWSDRRHFFAIAARLMRRVLLDHARRHRAGRRGGPSLRRVPFGLLDASRAAELATDQRADILLALDEALERLAQLEPRQARVIECRFFGGMTEAETADVLGLTSRTVARDWVKARGWLYQELCDEPV